MARNQSSEFRRSHEKTRILVKDYFKDFYLDLPWVIFLATRQRINFWIYSLLSLLQKFEHLRCDP